jgi:hypothetical protein
VNELVVRTRLTWLFGAFCLLLVGVFFIYQLRTPSDGARFDKSANLWDRRGIFLQPYAETSDLQENDLLVGIDGESVESLVERLFEPGMVSREWKAGQLVEYQVIRNGERLVIPIRLAEQPLLAILKAHWGVLLFISLTQALVVFVFLRRPDDPAAASAFIWGMAGSHFYVWSLYGQVPDIINGYGFWLFTLIRAFLWLSNWAAGVQFVLTFPHPLPFLIKRPGWIYFPYLFVFSFYLVFLALSKGYTENSLEWINAWGRGDSLAALLMFLPTIFILLYQYLSNRAQSDRKKIRLVVFSGIAVGSLVILFYLLPPFIGLSPLNANYVGVFMLLFPASMAFAILRHQLFDIDVIIRRTLIYSSLTVSLLIIYFASVVAFQQLFRSLSGQTGDSQAAIVLSTLVIAALFNPFRKRIQAFIDRRFYRRRYDAALTLEDFAAVLRDEVDMDQLSQHLLGVVEEAVHPETASLWLAKIDPGADDQGRQ